MAQLPSQIWFTCENCELKLSPKSVKQDGALCPGCGSSSWKMTIVYSESDTSLKAAMIRGAATSAFGLLGAYATRDQSFSTESEIPVLQRDDVLEITHNLDDIHERVVEYYRRYRKEEIAARGGKNCQVCDATFVPVDSKSWTGDGFCSIVCARKAGKQVDGEVKEKFTSDKRRVVNINVECSQGHQFEVMASFEGCFRPCPTCDEKCMVGE